MTKARRAGKLSDPMSEETTVLLVKGEPLPDGLQALLETKGVFVEEASPSHLEASLIAVAPDLILVFGTDPLDAIVPKLAAESNEVPVVVVADRQLHRDLRQKHKAGLGTIVPSDLPQSALAHRIATLSRRASKGEALVQSMSLAPPKAAPQPSAQAAAVIGQSPSVPDPLPALGQKAALGTVGPKLQAAAKKDLAAAKAPTGTSSVGRGAGEAPKQAAGVGPQASRAAAPKAESPAGGSKSQFQKAAVAVAREGLARAAPRVDPTPAASPTEPAGRKSQIEAIPAKSPEPEPPSAAFPADDDFPTAAFRIPLEVQQRARRESVPPATVRRQVDGQELIERANQEALVAQELEARQRLSSGGDEPVPTMEDERRAAEADQRARYHRRSHATASAVRLVLCDDDMTRADSLASELREHGLDVMLLSPEHSQVRWPRLRRFAPHGLLVDERSLSKGGRQIVSAFRRDPFLKYVPLVVVPFQRIYREVESRANLAPVFPLLAPLGREELGLLEQLRQKGEVAVDLSQILPSRLVEVLGENETTCVLSTSGAGRRLTWPIAAGSAGKAELTEGVGSQGSSLKPEEALRFLLEQDEAQVLVAQRPQIHLTAAESIGVLLDRVTSSIDPPLQHSVAPGQASEARSAPKATLLGVAPPASAAVDPGTGVLPTIPAPPGGAGIGPESPMFSVVRGHGRTPAADGEAQRALAAEPALGGRGAALLGRGSRGAAALADQARAGLSLARTFLAEKRRTWPPPLYWAVLSAPLVLLVLVVLLWVLLRGDDEGATVAAQASSAPAAPAAAPAPAPAAAGAPAFDRFRVAADQPAKACDEVLSGIPGATSGGDPSAFWKLARQALMQGNVVRAHEMMCRAVARDPAGAAAEGLVAFYLGRRALGRADQYVQGILSVDPERRTARELQSDVRNQQGQVDEALRLLLLTLRLEPSDSARRTSVSRKFFAEADLAIKSGDFPLAERLLRRSVVLSPGNDQAALRLAEVFLRAGLRDAAKLWAESLLAGPTRHGEAHMILGDVARLSGDPSTARRHYEQVTFESGQQARAQAQLKSLP